LIVENKLIWSQKGMFWIQRKRINPFIEEVIVNFPSRSIPGAIKTVKQRLPRGYSFITAKALSLLLA